MSNNRKIQQEIDKLLKKVAEGMDVYEEVFDKVMNAPSQTQKERVEADLKKEIKKLQRHREQVRALLGSTEVKDKKALETCRRQIETKMESFKNVERETKTKAYSKEGLAQRSAVDPADAAKHHTHTWIRSGISDLNEQVEQLEADIEAEGGLGVKKKKGKVPDERETRLERLHYHIGKLEQLLRCVDNDELTPEDADCIEDELQDYVANNADPEYIEGDDLYEQFDLPEITDAVEAPVAAVLAVSPKIEEKEEPKKPAADVKKKADEKKEEESGGRVIQYGAKVEKVAQSPTVPAPAKAAPAKTAAKKEPAAPQTKAVPPPSPQQTAKPKTPNTTPSTPAVQQNKGAMAPPPGVTGPTPPQTLGGGPEFPDQPTDDMLDMDAKNEDTFGDDIGPISGGGMGSMGLADLSMMTMKAGSAWGDPLGGRPPAAEVLRSPPKPKTQDPSLQGLQQVQQSAQLPMPAPMPQMAPPAPQAPPAAQQPEAQSADPNSPANARATVNKMLDMSFHNLPHPNDSERLKPYIPPNPYRTPSYYPQTAHPAFSSPEIFSKLDVDTLFFAFYYQQSTFQQYLAARELKKQSWRFHRKFLTWFQRHDKPKVTTDEYEQGTYVYFDYDSGWCQRIKHEFAFKYSYLEDELV